MKRFIRRPLTALVLTVALCIANAAPLWAAELRPDATPEAVLHESFRRMKAGEWTSAADAFDPAALTQLRDMLAPILESEDGAGVATMFFGDGASPASLKSMSDQAFFAGLMSSIMQTAGGSLESQEVLGGVAEGPDRMHMVVRNKAAAMGLSITQMEVVTLNKTPQGWRLALSGKMEGMAQALKQLGGKPRSESTNAKD
ncbi:MAG: hypothetical protein KA144_13185 [Xanthomonadaceae bacterium]|nr:hypothetical protein [Xanthomonadaceae bacterium]